MNKIFKVKRNSLGQSAVCSEIATSRSKGRVVASALALTVLASATATQAFAQDTDDSSESENPLVLIEEHFGDTSTTIDSSNNKEYFKLLYQVAVNHEADLKNFSEWAYSTKADLDDFSEWAYRTQYDILSMAEHVDDALAIKANKVDVDANTAAIANLANITRSNQDNIEELAHRNNDVADLAITNSYNIINMAENVDAALATKANQSAVDALKQADTYLASIAGTNQGNIAKLQTEVGTIGADLKKKADQEQVNTLGNKVDAFDTKINTLQSGHQNLNGKINRLDKDLSAGIAGSVALAMMPAPAAGSQYITGGTGFYNGESAVALGFTGATETGKFTYKLGGSLTSSGSGTFGAGAGYRWK